MSAASMAPAARAMVAVDPAVKQRPASATCAGRPRSAGLGKSVRQKAAKLTGELGGALDASKPLQLPAVDAMQPPPAPQRQQHGLHGAMLDSLAADLRHSLTASSTHVLNQFRADLQGEVATIKQALGKVVRSVAEDFRQVQAQLLQELGGMLKGVEATERPADAAGTAAALPPVLQVPPAVDLSPVLDAIQETRTRVIEVDLSSIIDEVRKSRSSIDFSPVLAEIRRRDDGAGESGVSGLLQQLVIDLSHMREDVSKLQQGAPGDVRFPRAESRDTNCGVDLSPVLREIEQLRCEQARIGVDLPRALQDLRESQGTVDFSPVLGEIAKVGAEVSAFDLSPVLAEIEQLKARIGDDLPRTLQDLRENQGNIDFTPVLNEISNLTDLGLRESEGTGAGASAIDLSPVLAEIEQLRVRIGEDLASTLQNMRESQGTVDFSPVLGEIAKVGATASAIDLSPVLAEIEQLKARIGDDLPRTLQDLRANQGTIDLSPVLNEISNLTVRDLRESHTLSPVLCETAKLTVGRNVEFQGDEGVERVTGDAGVQQAMVEISRMRAEMNSQQTDLQDDVSSVADEDKDDTRTGDIFPLRSEIGQLKADVLDAIEKLKGGSGADSRGEASLAQVTTQLSCIREDVASLLEETRSERPSADGDISAVLEDLRRVRETVETDLPRLVKELVENNQPSVEIKVDDSSVLDRVWVDMR